MTKRISRLLFLCLLLCGCSSPKTVQPVAEPAPVFEAAPGLYDPGSRLEISSKGAIKVFPLETNQATGLLPFGDGFLLLSGEETTTLTVLTGERLVPGATKTLPFSLDAKDIGLLTQGLSCFDTQADQLLLLDFALDELCRIDGPEAMLGDPVLSPNGDLIYYAVPGALRVLDRETGISRILKETHIPVLPEKLFCNGTVLQCRAWDPEESLLFLSTETGKTLKKTDPSLVLTAGEGRYTASFWQRNLWCLVFGTESGQTQALTPRALSASYFPLSSQTALVTAVQTGEVLTLDHYDLLTGQRTASQMLPGQMPISLADREGRIYLLFQAEGYDGPVICSWDPAVTPVSDSHAYTGSYFTAAAPDKKGLAQCRKKANALAEAYGLEILVWKDAARDEPHLEPEYRVNILNRELELLDQRLAQFPEGMIAATAGDFGSFQICLVSQVRDSPCSGESLQWFQDRDAFLALAPGENAGQAFYHSLFHVMETHIFSHSSALDQWSSCNPKGFKYDFDYARNRIRNSGIYLAEESRAFLDTFSMSYPKEDRARIFEYAMMPGQAQLFRSDAMQKKLETICRGIREAYGLSAEERYPWEQYLK